MTRSHLRVAGLCAFVLLVAVAPAAFGADPRDTAIPSLGSLTQALDALFGAADKMVSTLKPVGEKLLALAVVLELLYAAYMFFIKGGASDFLASGFRTLIVTSVPLALLASWPQFPLALVDMFTSGVTQLVTGHAGGASDQVGSMLDSISKMAGQLLVPTPGGWFQHVIHPIDTTVDAMTNLLVGIVMLFAVVMFSVALLFATFGPLVMLKIGIIMGPILLPLLVWKPTSDIAMKWFSYMLSMCVAYVLGLVLAQLALGAMTAQIDLVQQQAGTFDTVMVTLLGLIPTVLAMVFCGFLLLKVEHVAAALIGGASIGSGAVVFAGALGAMKGGGGKGGGGGGNKGGGRDAGSKDGGGGEGGSGKPLLNPTNGKVTSGSDAKGQADLSKQAATVSGDAKGQADLSKQAVDAGGGDKKGGGKDSESGTDAAGGENNPSASAPADRPDASAPGDKPDASAPGEAVSGSEKPDASATGDAVKPAPDGQDGEKSAAQGAAGPSKAARATGAVLTGGKFAVGRAWNGARAVGGTSFGKAAAFTTATMVAGPVAGAVVGAFAVSPKLRGMVSKGGDKLGALAGPNVDKLVNKLNNPKSKEGEQHTVKNDAKDSLGE